MDDDQAPTPPDDHLDASLGVAINVAGDILGSMGRDVGQVPLVGEQLERGVAEGATVAHVAAEHYISEAISEQLSSSTPTHEGLVDTFDTSTNATGLPVLTPSTYPGEVPAEDPARDTTVAGGDPSTSESAPATPASVVDDHPALGLNRDNPFPDWDQPAGDSDLPTLTPATYPGDSPFPDDDDGPSPLTGSGTIGESDDPQASTGSAAEVDPGADNPYQDEYSSYADDSSDGVDRSQEGGE